MGARRDCEEISSSYKGGAVTSIGFAHHSSEPLFAYTPRVFTLWEVPSEEEQTAILVLDTSYCGHTGGK